MLDILNAPLALHRAALGRVHDDTVNISTLEVKAVPQPTNGDGVVRALLQSQLQRRGQDNALVAVSLEQRLNLLHVAVHHNRSHATQLPFPADAIGRAAGLVAETHVVRVLVVKRHPLRLAGALDPGKGNGTVVAVDARHDGAAAGKGGFLPEGCTSGGGGVVGVVGRAFNGSDDARLNVEVVDVVPFHVERLLFVVDDEGQPDVAALPEGVGVPLVAEVEIRRDLGPLDLEGEAGLGVVRAGVGVGDEEGLRPGAGERVGAEGDDVVGAVARLVGHEGVVALVRLDDGRGLEVVLVEAVDDLGHVCDVFVKGRDVDVAALAAVAVGVERVGASVLVVGEDAKVLGPVAEGRGGVDKGVGARDVG